ncbi:MAG: hypothetical protein FWD53_03445 [Phycisphaerales bacterium]|nr:hypothetical protein [Phycisphaerales bacterium]
MTVAVIVFAIGAGFFLTCFSRYGTTEVAAEHWLGTLFGWGAYVVQIILLVGVAVMALVFLIVGLRNFMFGGEWKCLIDDDTLTWAYPGRMFGKDGCEPLTNIQRFTILLERGGWGYHLQMAEREEKLCQNIFGDLDRFIDALVSRNNKIVVEIRRKNADTFEFERRKIRNICKRHGATLLET